MAESKILQELIALRDDDVADFNSRIIPDISRESVLGIKTPALKAMAKKYYGSKEAEEFMGNLPHKLFEENQLHVFLIALNKDFDLCMKQTLEFLPYINNWATCDQFSPKVFAKHKEEIKEYCLKWMQSDETYTIRFGILNLMRYFLKEDFDFDLVLRVVEVKSSEYYVNMMISWYLATALAYRYEDIIPLLEDRKLDPWIHNKTISKARDSFRITGEQKVYLKSLALSAKERR